MSPPDVAVVGGGIVGLAIAAFLAEGGAQVRVYERDELAAGASGRNSGVLQHPLDRVLEPLFTESLRHYADLAAHGFPFPAEPTGAIVLSARPEAVATELATLAALPGAGAGLAGARRARGARTPGPGEVAGPRDEGHCQHLVAAAAAGRLVRAGGKRTVKSPVEPGS